MHTRNDHLSPVKLVQLTNVTHVNGIYLTIRKNFLEHRAMMLINEKICLLSYCIRRRPCTFINCCGMDGMKKNQLDLLSYSVGKMPMNFLSHQVKSRLNLMTCLNVDLFILFLDITLHIMLIMGTIQIKKKSKRIF